MVGIVLALWGCFGGCATGPVFMGITEITLHTQTPAGVHKETLEGDQLNEAVACLEGGSLEISESDQSSEGVLQEIILVQVKDRLGDRMFELTTNENFSGNKGKFYRNNCIYRIVKQKK